MFLQKKIFLPNINVGLLSFLYLKRFYQQYCLCYVTKDKILYHTFLPNEYESDNRLRTKKAHQATTKKKKKFDINYKFFVSIKRFDKVIF